MLDSLAATNVHQMVQLVLEQASKLPPNHFFWYRGISCSEHKLLPSLMRGPARDMKEVLERERRLVTRFRQRSLPYWAEGYPQSDWEHLFAMQHNGMPTRLLDWTENLFVALYFALTENQPTDEHMKLHPGASCSPVVWLLNPKAWNQRALEHQEDGAQEISVLTITDEELKHYAPELTGERFVKRYKSPVALYGTHNSARIVAQRGTFTIAGNEWKPLEDYAASMRKEELGGLTRISINMDLAQARRDVAALGFTESMVYPDLPGLSRELARSEGWR